MEVVSELLGHSKITVTQDSYAMVIKSRFGMRIEVRGENFYFKNFSLIKPF